MDSDDNDNFDYSDTEIDDKKHDRLVEDVLNLSKVQNLKKPSRSEPTLQISEFNLVKSVTGNKGSVHLNELTKVLKNRKKHVEIDRKIKSGNQTKTLPRPLEKPQADRIRRTVAYEKSRLEFDRWEAIVTSNRASTHLSFPLDDRTSLKIEENDAKNYTKTWRIKSDLQKELENLKPKVEEYHVDTEKQKFTLTAEEVLERRKEAAKLRAHQSYKESKARRQNKIKSKKYHRVQKREKIKKILKEFEDLQKSNPEEALKKLEDIEKARAEERFSLRHRGTGQWAKNKQIRAKYDKESRQVLSQQLSISRDLTQKLKPTDDSEDEGIDSDDEKIPEPKTDPDNPWVSDGGIKPGKDVADFLGSYRKYWQEKNENAPAENPINEVKEIPVEEKEEKPDKVAKKVKKVKKKKSAVNLASSLNSTSEWDVSLSTGSDKEELEDIFERLEDKLTLQLKNKLNSVQSVGSKRKLPKSKVTKETVTKEKSKKKKIDLKLPSKSKKHVIDEELEETPRGLAETDANIENSLTHLKNILQTPDNSLLDPKKPNIDPEKFIKVKPTHLNTAIPDLLTAADEESDEETQRNAIMEAFEDDDIVQDFNKEKNDEVDKDKPKDIDLNLPGWGSWGGTNIKPNRRKQRRFIIKMPVEMPRKDDNKGMLIINEKAQSKIRPHLVSEVPFPFKTVKDYEASIRAPIGNTFVPETAFKKFIQPALTTKMGAIIEPMSRNLLVNKKVK